MEYIEFLSTHSQVETIIGLLSFIFAGVLAYLARINTLKINKVGEIIKLADTKDKVDLATTLSGFIPSYKIPDLSKKDGFAVIKLDMEKKEREFMAKMSLIKVGIVIFSVLILALLVTTYIKFDNQEGVTTITTTGPNSPITGDDSKIIYNGTKDTMKK